MGVNHAPEGVKINEAGLSAQLPVQPETAPESKISTPLENAIADIIAQGFADELKSVANSNSQTPIGNIGIGNRQHSHNGNIQQVATNAVDAQGNEHSEANGRFVPKGEGREGETKPQHDRYGSNDISKLTAEPGKNAERAKVALDEVLRKKEGHIDKAAYRPECGWIRLDWGDAGNPNDNYKGGHGIAHIMAKHPEALKSLPDVIAKGDAFRHPQDDSKLYFVHGDKFAVVASLRKGAKKTITSYEPNRPGDIAKIKTYPQAAKPGENKGR